MKIAVYTITKNEEQFIQRWAESCKEADYRLIVDTGSTDNTVRVAIENGCEVRSITIKPWRFDDARNASLALIPEDVDICIALDADEVLMPGWREALENTPSGVTRPRYKYVWSWNPDGSEGLVYSGDKIHARKNYRWVHPVHEVLQCTTEEVQHFCSGVEIHHHPDPTKSRSQYLPLLELAVRERPQDDRNQFYLGREYMFNNMPQDAERHLLKHLELSVWDAERATAMRYLSRVTPRTEHWLLRACAEAPHRREPWVELAQHYYNTQKWWQSLSAAMRALEISEKPLEYLCESESWGSLPHDLVSIAAWNTRNHKLAAKHARIAMDLNPHDPRLRNNYALICSLSAKSNIDVVIPTKSNMEGLKSVVKSLVNGQNIDNIIIIADGDKAYQDVWALDLGPRVRIGKVMEASGIHVMWNLGMELGNPENHVAFVNDDVVLEPNTISVLGGQLDLSEELGLVCPNYDNRFIPSSYFATTTTCRGDYSGTGGLAGFCMVLAKDLRKEWSFDERMMWWYGDDDIVNWVNSKRRVSAISGITSCSENQSWTITNDPPPNFSDNVEMDKKIFLEKWATNAC